MKSTTDINTITQLIDNYGKLLSPCKKRYIEGYYFDNYSLRDIAATYNISHAAVHDAIKDGINELRAIENDLKFISMQKKRIEFYEEKITDKKLLQELIELEYGKVPTC